MPSLMECGPVFSHLWNSIGKLTRMMANIAINCPPTTLMHLVCSLPSCLLTRRHKMLVWCKCLPVQTVPCSWTPFLFSMVEGAGVSRRFSGLGWEAVYMCSLATVSSHDPRHLRKHCSRMLKLPPIANLTKTNALRKTFREALACGRTDH